MFKDYQDYLNFHNNELLPFSEKHNVVIRKKTLEQFLIENYKDRVEHCLMEQYKIDAFHDLFFGKGDMDSDELTREEILYERLYNVVCRTIEVCREFGFDIDRTSRLIFDILTIQGVLVNSEDASVNNKI